MSTAASRPASDPPLIVVMGVSGCGKTSVGEGLAAGLGAPFLEGDVLHPPENVRKMASGIPLDDADRWPWLDRIGGELARAHADGVALVISCSALKRIYRDRLRERAGGSLAFVFLKGSRALLHERLAERKGHFFPPALLDSQLATLQDPSGEPGVLTLDIAATVPALVRSALHHFRAMKRHGPHPEVRS